MKKNMLAVLILLLTVVNLTLSVYTVFTVIPNAKRTDELITKILQVIDLELEDPIVTDVTASQYSIKDLEKYELSSITTNIAIGADGKTHYAQVNASLSINKLNADYEVLNPLIDTFRSDITSIITANVSKYSYEQLGDPEIKATIKADVLSEIQILFDSKFIVDCTIDCLIQ